MKTMRTWRRRLVVPLLATAAVALPLGLRADGTLDVAKLCAQGDICVRDDNFCHFVNGVPYPGRWEST